MDKMKVNFVNGMDNGKALQAAVPPDMTTDQVLNRLQSARTEAGSFLGNGDGSRMTLVLKRTNQVLPFGTSLARAGVQENDVIVVIADMPGGSAVRGPWIGERRAMDWRILDRMRGPLFDFEAYSSNDSLAARRPILTSAQVERATHFLCRFKVQVPIDASFKRGGPIQIHVDASGRDYPMATPTAVVAAAPIPWSPHFHFERGLICTEMEERWARLGGAMNLGVFVVHLMKLLNWDEPTPGPSYRGLNMEALEAWKRSGCKPLDPALVYPLPPTVDEACDGGDFEVLR